MSFINYLIPAKVKQHVKNNLGVPNMFWSLRNMKNNGFNLTDIVVIGAYQSKWNRETKAIFPDAIILFI